MIKEIEWKYCNELCTKPVRGFCKLCNIREEADRFAWIFCGGWIWTLFDKLLFPGLWNDLRGPYGYRVVVAMISLYFGFYAVVEARHSRQMTRSWFERDAFFTLALSKDRQNFILAMKNFGQVQGITIYSEPWLWKPLRWWNKIQPNRDPLWQWAKLRFEFCEPSQCGGPQARIDLTEANLKNAQMHDVDLSESNLWKANFVGANLEYADLEGANLELADLRLASLKRASLHGAKLWETDLRGANLDSANFTDANLEHANFEGANLESATLLGAKLGGTNLRKTKGITCPTLKQAKDWQNAARDTELACGASRPDTTF